MNYEYTDLKDGERQYDDYDLDEVIRVPAIYVKSKNVLDNGNPYIEALPRPRAKKEISRIYTKTLTGYNYEEHKKLDYYDKLSAISSLRKVRYPLPFHSLLEDNFYLALLNSYRERKCFFNKGDELKIQSNDENIVVHNKLCGRTGAASNAGVTLLGYSGCGKSAAIEILLSNYPQVIEHTSAEVPRFTQITYLVVVCPANSNFAALYTSIGAEIDKALGNIEPYYEKIIEKQHGLASKADKVCTLIELFGIGCIIFDEIQLIDFKSQKENTFEGLLTIVNKTKVALMAVGTKDAYDKMFPNLRTSRRTGVYIEANKYCENKTYFSSIVTNLMKYQWFDEYVEPTSDIIKTLHEVTKGIIDQLISIYIYMQIDYLRAKKKPTVNSDYIRKISDMYYPGVQKLLAEIEHPDVEKECYKLTQQAKLHIEKLLSDARQEESSKMLIDDMNSKEYEDINILKDKIIKNIQHTIAVTGEVYNLSRIEKAVNHIINLKSNANCTEAELTQKAYQWLKKHPSDKRPGTKKKPKMDEKHIAIRNMLEEN